MRPPGTAADDLLSEIRACRICAEHLPAGPRPVVQFSATSRLLIIGQAPGRAVHASGIPWDDPSGRRLRTWLGLSPEEFYDPARVALVPMGFCYPGKGRSGDLPPRPECAPTWHDQVLGVLDKVDLTLLIGSYAIAAYAPGSPSMTAAVERGRERLDGDRFVLPHPSPRNQGWLRSHPWFEDEVVPVIRTRLRAAFDELGPPGDLGG